MCEATDIKLKADCELERAIERLSAAAKAVGDYDTPQAEAELVEARAHLLEVIQALILTGIRSQPVEGLRRANKIMGVEE